MHKDLEDWLNQVWAARTKIMGMSPTGKTGRGVHLGDANPAIWEVYRMYNESEGGGDSSSDVSLVAGFIDELDALEKATGGAALLQVGNNFVRLNRGQLANIKVSDFNTTNDEGKAVVVTKETVGDSFIHFPRGRAKVITKHRIYINVKREHLGPVFKAMTSDIWNESCLTSAKVAGPLGKARADSIVIYLSDGPGREGVIAKIRAYYDKNKGHFGGSTPKLTVPVEGMPGVSTGMEPPGLTLVSSGGEFYGKETKQSFGFYRASIIFMALDRTEFVRAGQTDADRCAAYKRRAAKYFVNAGIDPDRPAEQAPPANLKSIKELDVDIEGTVDPKTKDYKPGAKVHIKH